MYCEVSASAGEEKKKKEEEKEYFSIVNLLSLNGTLEADI